MQTRVNPSPLIKREYESVWFDNLHSFIITFSQCRCTASFEILQLGWGSPGQLHTTTAPWDTGITVSRVSSKVKLVWPGGVAAGHRSTWLGRIAATAVATLCIARCSTVGASVCKQTTSNQLIQSWKFSVKISYVFSFIIALCIIGESRLILTSTHSGSGL